MSTMYFRGFQYIKPKRFRVGAALKQKDILSPEEAARLLGGVVVVEEKLDGRPISHEVKDPALVIFAEDMKQQHTIHYRLPGRYAIFDIFDSRRGVFVISEERIRLAAEIRNGKIRLETASNILFFPVPRIGVGRFSMEDLTGFLGRSAYAEDEGRQPAPGEGIVVKPNAVQYPRELIAGKIVREEFTGQIGLNYLTQPYRGNAIDIRRDVVVDI